MPTEYSADTTALTRAGGSVAGLREPCQAATTALRGIALPGAAVSVAPALAAFAGVWGDAVNALATAYDSLGANLATAATGYNNAEAAAQRAYRRAERNLGGPL